VNLRIKSLRDNNCQQLAVMFGYKLKQNFKWHPQSRDRWETGHPIQIVGHEVVIRKDKNEKEDLAKLMRVNSHHHQGIIHDPSNEHLTTLAYYDDHDGRIVEAFRHNILPIIGIQWHPEELYDEYSDQLITELLGL